LFECEIRLLMVQFKWQRLPGHRGLKGRAGHTATLVGKKIYVFGGRNGNVFHNDVWVFDTETERWQLLQMHAAVSPRAYHTATLVGDEELWIIGGSDKVTMFGDVHMLNTRTLEWKTLATTGSLAGRVIGTHAAVVHPLQPGAILVFGGYGGAESVWLKELAILHTDALEWETLNPKGSPPCARGYHTMTCVGQSVILYGGKGDHGIVSSGENLSVYNAATNAWAGVEVKGNAPVQRSNHAAALVGESLVVIHGGRNGSERLRDTSALKVSSGSPGQVRLTWHTFPQEPAAKPRGRKRAEEAAETLANNPGGRAAHSLVARGDALYVFGGSGGSGVTFDDLYVLRSFVEVTGLGDVEEAPARTPVRRSGRRFSFPVEEPEPGPGPIEGWRSTKKPRRPAAGTLDYSLDANGGDDNVPAPAPATRQVVTDLTETPPLEKDLKKVKEQVDELVSKARSEKDFLKVKEQVNELVTKSRSEVAERLSELEVQRREVASLQQTVAALTSEIRAKSVGEMDIRERNAVLEHNLEVYRQQVSTLNEKLERLTAENAGLRSGCQVLETQKSDRARERSDLVSKISSLEERLADRDRELSKTLQMLGTAETKAAEKSRLLEEAKKEKKAAVVECGEHRMKAHKMEVELRSLEQARESHEKERAALQSQLAECKTKLERVSGELAALKDSSRTLQDTVERLAKQLERENSRADALERDRDELRRANATLSSEISQITSSRESAEAAAELVRSELRTARVLLERSETENGRLQEAADNAREHFATQHATMRKYEEDAKAFRDENERLRKLVSEMEEFEHAQARTFQTHVEKIRIARQM
jgi:N-acetylneuraminic acid mutarotase